MHYRLGCNTLYPFGRLSNVREQFDLTAQKAALRIVRDAGFDGCEFSHYECLSATECLALRGECAALGLEPWSAHSWVTLAATEADAADKAAAIAQSLEMAAHLGAQVMVVHADRGSFDLSDPEQRQLRRKGFLSCLGQVSARAGDLGLRVAVENCSNREDLEFMIETVEALGGEHVGFNVDTGHAVLHGMRPDEVVRLMGPRLFTTHLQDNFGERDDHLPPGRGNIDWPPVIAAIRDVGYGGTLMVEISDCPPGREPDAEADTFEAYTNLRKLAGTR